MGIKQSIVIKNRFTMSDGRGSGTRGATPGAYVERYMGRDGATEAVLPVAPGEVYDYLTRYAARADAVEAASTLNQAKQDVSSVAALDGVAFSGDSISLDKRSFKRVSREIQSVFDDGRPVLECVLSFDTEYLKKHGLVDSNLDVKFRGDLRGKVDQLRLRSAVQSGMRSLGNRFDDLLWVGVLQFDTKHVHAHLAMAERDPDGDKRRRRDGQHRGVLTERDKVVVRRGIDDALDESRYLPHMSAEVSDQRANVKSYVRDFAYQELTRSGDMQLIMATLPDDRRLWRASSSRREMSRPNELALDFVHKVFEKPDSGYSYLEASIETYARHRCRQEGAGPDRERQLRDCGIERLERECVNAVYQQIAQWSNRPVHTKAIDIMASDIAEAAQLSDESEADEWLFRVRTYGGRLREARESRAKFHELGREWDERERQGRVDAASRVARDYYAFEESYQRRIMAKYLNLLPLGFVDGELKRDIDEYRESKARLVKMESMLLDDRFMSLPADEAERLGRIAYGIRGASDIGSRPDVFARRMELARIEVDDMARELEFKLEGEGRGLMESPDGTLTFPKIELEPFHAVRGCDLHRLRYDFSDDVAVSRSVVQDFSMLAQDRSRLADGCLRYFSSTGQVMAKRVIPVEDINAMSACARDVMSHGILRSARSETDIRTPIHTVEIGSSSADIARVDVERIIANAELDLGYYMGD